MLKLPVVVYFLVLSAFRIYNEGSVEISGFRTFLQHLRKYRTWSRGILSHMQCIWLAEKTEEAVFKEGNIRRDQQRVLLQVKFKTKVGASLQDLSTRTELSHSSVGE